MFLVFRLFVFGRVRRVVFKGLVKIFRKVGGGGRGRESIVG